MATKRRKAVDGQGAFAWTDPASVLAKAERRGRVVFEAPEAAEIAQGQRVPRVAARPLALPFGLRVDGGRLACWTCARELGDDELVRAAPGFAVCPGCGARLPFAE